MRKKAYKELRRNRHQTTHHTGWGQDRRPDKLEWARKGRPEFLRKYCQRYGGATDL